MEYLRHYIDLHLLKDSRGMNVEVNLDHSAPDVRIAPMLLIPFVENAFKHSQVENLEKGWIKINLLTTDEYLLFIVSNSVPELSFTKDKSGGIGLSNVQRQLELLYPGKHELKIDSHEPAVFSIYLKLYI
jgi:LytS/YehU family sensor histidine kinase